ncbi:pancreatic triacylglycerol lipase-like [Cimex lectularius]|uniref:Lipase domain-containing protein n=1 Tax=Cimex lectularius TaxID=79782 RepID=A0A8I6RM88_CIMLE|nr:pancreatic triacylglycerol lipase-like [Cimex lectularius]
MQYLIIAGILIASLASVLGEQVTWSKIAPYFTNDNKDFVLFNNSYGEPVFVSLRVVEQSKPINLSLEGLIKYYLYTSKNSQKFQELWKNDKPSLTTSNFDASKKTIFVIHGYMNNIYSDSIQSIKNNVLKQEDINVIGVDWSLISDHLFYHIIAAEVPGVGAHVSEFVSFLMSNGLKYKDIHMIGHSLGAHVASFAAKNLKTGKFARLTGLDAALPGFEKTTHDQRLNPDDAEFVDCVHTCGGVLGFLEPLCQVDFYANGGTNVQPGCPWADFGSCSHGRAHEYFAESILKDHKFPSLSCPSLPGTTHVNCTADGALMGYPATNRYLGIHYTQTNSSYPYALVKMA